jgi:hypothetical protein
MKNEDRRMYVFFSIDCAWKGFIFKCHFQYSLVFVDEALMKWTWTGLDESYFILLRVYKRDILRTTRYI